MEADKMLDVYIHDYLVKRKLGASARTFQAEAQVLTNRTAIDAPGGFLLEWWSVFWDIFIARFKNPVSSTTGSYNVVQLINTLEQKDVQAQQLNQMQQLIRQKQQQGDGTQLLRGTTNEAITRQSLGTTNALTKRIYESHPPVQRNPVSVANKKKPTKPRSSDSNGQHLDANHSFISKPETFRDQHSRQARHSFPGDNLRFYPPLIDQAQQLPVPQLDQSLANMMIPAVSLKAAESGSDHGVNSLLLKGWPLMELEQLQSGLIQRQSSTIHLSHPSQHQLQQKILMLLSDQYMDINEGDQSNFIGNIAVDKNLPVQVGLPLFPRAESDMLMKNINHRLEQGQLPVFFGKHPENPSSSIQQQDKRVATSSTTLEVSLSNTSRGDDQADVSLINHGSANNSVGSFLSVNAHTESIIPRCLGTSKDITFLEIGTFHSSAVNCCDLSSDGKLLVNGGDKEVVLWWTDSREQKHVLEEHADAITDVRFGPRLPRLASSSLDKTIKIWDVHNPDHSIRSFTGHSASVMSLDFHPTKEDLICSCDNVSTIRYWSIKNGGCAGMSKVPATQVRFQPNLGKYLAAAVADGVLLIDVETTQVCRYPLKGHISNIRGICWSSSGEYLASLSEDMVKVWKIGSSVEQECMHERSVKGERFRCCTFHPCYPSVLVVGSYECLELWHMAENKVMILLEEPVNSLAASQPAGVVASATDNNSIRLWK